MKRLENELFNTPETTLFGKFKNIIIGTSVYIVWATLVLLGYNMFIPDFGVNNSSFSHPHSSIYIFFSSCILTPLFEELFFRTPLGLLKKLDVQYTLYYIILSSVFFGYLHPLGLYSIPIQGFLGVLFCYVYLKNGYSYLSVVFMHFLINFFYFIK